MKTPGPDSAAMTPARWGAILALLVLAVALRSYGIARFPTTRDIIDEHHYVWAGLSLIDTGKATSWSGLAAHQKAGAILGRIVSPTGGDPDFLPIASPALDHPPLFSVAAGLSARLAGARSELVPLVDGGQVRLYDFDAGRSRWLPLLAAALSIWLLFDLMRRESGFPPALLAAALYAVTAHAVWHQRALVPESLTTPLLLGNLWAVRALADGRWGRGRFAAVTVLTTAAAPLCKLVAFSNAGAVAFLLLLSGRRREVLWPALGSAAGLLLYLAYGAWQGWPVFTQVLAQQSGRFTGFHTLAVMITSPRLMEAERQISFTLLAGWISMSAILFTAGARWGNADTRPDDTKAGSAEAVPAAADFSRPFPSFLFALPPYLVGHVFFAAQKDVFGWHLLPIHPFLLAGLALLAITAWRSGAVGPAALFALLFIPHAFEVVRELYAPLSTSLEARLVRYGYLLAAAAVMAGIALTPEARLRTVRMAVPLLLALTLIGELWQIHMRAG